MSAVTRPVLARQPSGCPICGSDKARLTASHTWSQHKPGPGYDDGVRYGTVSAQPNCPASGETREGVNDLLRTFASWGDPPLRGQCAGSGQFHRRTLIQDIGDSIGLDNILTIGDEDDLTISVRIRPEDTPRLLAELTAIAVARGLVPDPAAVVREAVAAELRALADSFAVEALRRHETGDDDMAEDDCADKGLSCHTNEAVWQLTAAKSRLRRRADELDPPVGEAP